MPNESCRPVMESLVAEGRTQVEESCGFFSSLTSYEVRDLETRAAFFLALPVVLLLAMMGYAAPATHLFRVLPVAADAEPCVRPGRRIVCMRGILPAAAGTAGRWTRTIFQD